MTLPSTTGSIPCKPLLVLEPLYPANMTRSHVMRGESRDVPHHHAAKRACLLCKLIIKNQKKFPCKLKFMGKGVESPWGKKCTMHAMGTLNPTLSCHRARMF
eukprot:363511-Chlamydomonas_euryale.AAC.11